MFLPNLGRYSSCFINIVAIVLMALASHATRADDDASMFSFQGFGTLGIAHSSENKADFPGNFFFQPNGTGHWRSWAASTDSKLGVQADARFSDKLSGVIQVVSQYDYDSTYTPRIEWANLTFLLTPDFSIRLGRTVASSFMMSETRQVGYSYPWIRLPEEIYALNPATNKDGIDVVYRFSLNDGFDALHASYGRTNRKLPNNSEGTASHYLDVQNTWESGATTIRVGYTSLDIDFHNPAIDGLFDGLVQFGNAVPGTAGQQALAISSRYRLANTPYSIVTFGVSHDPGNWLLMAEWATTKTSAVTADITAWYIAGAYRAGKFTPYLMLADSRADKPSVPSIPTAGLPSGAPGVGPLEIAEGLNGGLSGVIDAFAFVQNSVAVGVRWDFRRDADLKLQYQRLRTGPGSSGRLINTQPGFQPGKAVNVFSLAVDFVF